MAGRIDNREILIGEDNNTPSNRMLELAGLAPVEKVDEAIEPGIQVKGVFRTMPNGNMLFSLVTTDGKDSLPNELFKKGQVTIHHPGRNDSVGILLR